MKLKLFIVFLLYGLINTSNYCNAIEVKGYIVNLNHDTIYGTIKLPRFNQTTGALYLKGFDMESLSRKIKFKSNSNNSYQTFSPKTITSYVFVYDSGLYIYNSCLLKYKSIFNSERTRLIFLHLIYHGSLDLYEYAKYLFIPPNISFQDRYPMHFEYYLFSKSTGILWIKMTNQIKTVRDLLRKFNVDEEFIQEVPKNTKFKDIRVVLAEYDEWLLLQNKTGCNPEGLQPASTNH